MTEVYAENLRKGNLQLTPVDYRSFYREAEKFRRYFKMERLYD